MQVALQFQQCYLGAQNAGNESSCHAILKLSFGYCCRMGLRSHENIHIMQIIVWQRLQNWRICSVHFSSLTFKVVVEIRSVATEKCLNFRITSAWNRLSSFKTLSKAEKKLWLSPAVIHLLLTPAAFLERWKVAPNVTLFNHFPTFSFFKENLENPITSLTFFKGYKWLYKHSGCKLQWHMRNGRQLEGKSLFFT